MTAPRALSQNIWCLGNGYINAYLLQGKKASLLAEAGISATASLMIRQLQDLQISPDFILVTHPHADHVTGLPWLRQAFPRARILAHPESADFLKTPKLTAGFPQEDQHMTRFLQERGLVSGNPCLDQPPELEPYQEISSPDALDLGELRVRFIQVQGHAPGHLLLHIPKDEVVLVSDALGFLYESGSCMPLFFTDLAQFLQGIATIQQLGPHTLGPGHQSPVQGGSQVSRALERSAQAALNLRTWVRSAAKSKDALQQELFDHFYREELLFYSPENIRYCCRLLIKRSLESDVADS